MTSPAAPPTTWFVTGTSRGLGLNLVRTLLAEGANVAATTRSEARLLAGLDGVDTARLLALEVEVTDESAVGAAIATLQERFGTPDVVVNNAGYGYLGAVEETTPDDVRRMFDVQIGGTWNVLRAVLPGLRAAGGGHIINISSIGVLTNSPRFSAYVASKAALDAFSRCAQAEFSDNGVNFTTINMPLVKTPMIAPTKMYESVPTLSPDEAADIIIEAIIERPVRIATRLGTFAQVFYALAPRVYEIVMNTAFRLFPDSSAAKGMKGRAELEQPTSEQIAVAALMRGIHW